jgi:hypothetical protein
MWAALDEWSRAITERASTFNMPASGNTDRIAITRLMSQPRGTTGRSMSSEGVIEASISLR